MKPPHIYGAALFVPLHNVSSKLLEVINMFLQSVKLLRWIQLPAKVLRGIVCTQSIFLHQQILSTKHTNYIEFPSKAKSNERSA